MPFLQLAHNYLIAEMRQVGYVNFLYSRRKIIIQLRQILLGFYQCKRTKKS